MTEDQKENILPNVDELPTIIGKIEQDVKLMLDDLTHLMPLEIKCRYR